MHGFSANLKHDFVGIFGGLDPVWAGRLILTLILSGLIGLERSTHERASGLRTHILVGLGACLITMAGAYGFADIRAHGPASNPFVLATYVVSGIGFLGAGAILRHGTTLRGLTTAASVWNVAGVGIAVGAGMGTLAAVTVGLILFVLVPLQRWESRLRIGTVSSDLVIHLHHEGKAVGRTLALLSSMGLGVRRATVFPGAGTSVLLRVDLGVAPRADAMPAIVKQLQDSPDVERVETGVVLRSPQSGVDPDGENEPRKPFVRSRTEPVRDLTRRVSKKLSHVTRSDFSTWLEPESQGSIDFDQPVAPSTPPAAPPGPRSPEPSAQESGEALRPRRPRPRV